MADEVRLFPVPWVPNARAERYLGQIKVERFVPDGRRGRRARAWERAELRLDESLRAKALALGGNAVVSVEVTMDPWYRPEGSTRTGLHLRATGTAAKLERLFKDVPY